MTISLIILACALAASVVANVFLAKVFLRHTQDLTDKALIVQTEQQEFIRMRKEHYKAKDEIVKNMAEEARQDEVDEGWQMPTRLRDTHPNYHPDWGGVAIPQPKFDPNMTEVPGE